jgi:hypothetical protein
MPIARTVLPTDLVALVSYDGRVYPNEAQTRDRIGSSKSAPHPLESALEQWFSFATGRHTWISVKGATLRGLVSARRRGSRSAWEIDCLIDATGGEQSIVMSLLDEAVAEAGRNGVEKLFLRLAADSDALRLAGGCGFAAYTREHLYFYEGALPARQTPAEPLPLRRRTRHDAYPLYQLYNAAVPEPVRRIEAVTFNEWTAAQERHWLGARSIQLVFEEAGSGQRGTPPGGDSAVRLGAWLRSARSGDIGRFDLLVHPRRYDSVDALVDAALARLARASTFYALVPEYLEPVARALMCRGFREGPQFVALAKRTTVPAKAPQLAPAGLKQA